MAMIYSVRELAKGGKGIGRYRYIGQSDEQLHVIDELCDCDNGHPTHAEAEQCPKAKARLDKLFHRDIDSLRAGVDQKRRELSAAESALARAEAGGVINDGKMGSAQPWDHSDFS